MSQRFLHYTITSMLERNTASTTYLAVHSQKPARTVVLKLFHKPTFTNSSTQKAFLQETEKLSHLNHPDIVPLLEAGIEEGQAYTVSAYMPNGSLRVHLDRTYPQRLPFQQAMTIISQVGQGLIYLHSRYLIHGQITPEHILFDANGHALLSDFVDATKIAPSEMNDQNKSATFRYLAPEQFDGVQNELSDQYALCCVAYELLTGQAPFIARDPQELEGLQRYAEPTPPRQIISQLSPTLEQALLKGLAKGPTHRHVDIATFLTALQQAQIAITGANLPLPRAKRRTVPPVTTQDQPDMTIASAEEPDRDFDKFLQSIELGDEKGIVKAYSAPAETIEQEYQNPQSDLAALLESLSVPITSSQNERSDQASAAQEIKMLNPVSASLQQSTPPPSKTPHKSRTSLTIVPGWSTASKHSTAIMLWSLILLLMIGSLWTYNALAAKEQTSSALTLLSNLSNTSNPIPKTTIDPLGILAPAATHTSTQHQTAPGGKKTAIPTSIPTPKATSRPVIPMIVPTATPTPIATALPKPTPTPTVPVGQTIWLKSAANGNYVQGSDCSTSSPMLANATQVQTAEEFTVIANSDGTVDFQAVATGKYVSAKDNMTDTPLLSCVTALNGWEKFIWVNLGSGKIALKARNGDYVNATLSETNAPLYALATNVDSETTFTWGSTN